MGKRPTAASTLGLGGHSYIQELGNDPRPSPEEQRMLVSARLDSGVTLFDLSQLPLDDRERQSWIGLWIC